MSLKHNIIIGRAGIILLLSGLVITVISIMLFGALRHLSISLVTDIGVELAIVGVVLLVVFGITIFVNKRYPLFSYLLKYF